MANAYDYVAKFGKLKFEQKPFNEVDNLVFSLLTYLDFSGTRINENTRTLEEVGREYLAKHTYKEVAKLGIAMGKKLTPEAFFKEIKDFQTVKMEQELFNLEKKELKKLDKELDANDKLKEGDKKRELDSHRKNPTMSTATHKRKIIIDKRPASKSTSSIKRSVKKTAKKSTRKS